MPSIPTTSIRRIRVAPPALALAALFTLAIAAPVSAQDKPWSPAYDDLPNSTRVLLDRYAARCFRYDGKIWYADPQVFANREANTKEMRGRSPIPNSRLHDDARQFKQGQAVPPVAFNLADRTYVGEMDEEMAAEHKKFTTQSKGPDLLEVGGGLGGATERDGPALVTGEEVYAIMAERGVDLPDLYADAEVHDPAVYRMERVTRNGFTRNVKVKVKDATYRAAWKSRPHAASNSAQRVIDLMRRKREIAAQRLLVLEKNLTEALQDDPSRTADAERLVVLYLFEAESPDDAAKYLPLAAAEFAEPAKLAMRKVKTLSADEALQLGDWARGLYGEERYDSVDPLKTRARRAYEHYLATAAEDAEPRSRVEQALAELGE